MGKSDMTRADFAGLRRALGLTQVQLAARLGLTQTAITYYETGRRGISTTLAELMGRLVAEQEGDEARTAKKRD